MAVDETRRRFLRQVGVTGALSVSGVSGCLGQFSASGQSIRFGAILPVSLSGLLGEVAAHGTKAAEQAVEDVNRAGGPLGRKIEFTTNDSADRLADQADELMGLLDRFEIADATDEKSSPDAVAGDD